MEDTIPRSAMLPLVRERLVASSKPKTESSLLRVSLKLSLALAVGKSAHELADPECHHSITIGMYCAIPTVMSMIFAMVIAVATTMATLILLL